MISVIASLCAAVASLGCLYLLAAIFIVLLRKRKRNANPRPEPVTLLKPLHGAEPRLAECLMSFCAQDYPGPVQIIFGLQDGGDPALAIAKDLKEKFPALDIGITVDASEHGANAKVSNLINMNATAKHDILIAADSDILAPPDYLEQVAALLQKPGAGVVSVLYTGESTGSMWSRLAAAWINTHFLPSVMVGTALGLAKPCFGSTIALNREALERIGGFEAFASQLADDYAIGAAVRKAEFSVEIGPATVGHVCHEEKSRRPPAPPASLGAHRPVHRYAGLPRLLHCPSFRLGAPGCCGRQSVVPGFGCYGYRFARWFVQGRGTIL